MLAVLAVRGRKWAGLDRGDSTSSLLGSKVGRRREGGQVQCWDACPGGAGYDSFVVFIQAPACTQASTCCDVIATRKCIFKNNIWPAGAFDGSLYSGTALLLWALVPAILNP